MEGPPRRVRGRTRLRAKALPPSVSYCSSISTIELAQAERRDLADFLATLAPSDWDESSLCAGWRVRDVVAHMVSYGDLGPSGLMKRVAAGRFSPSRINQVGVAEYASRAPDELVDLLRTHAAPRGLIAGFGGRIGLTDTLVHHQDIRRPLGARRDIAPERLRTAVMIHVMEFIN